MTRRRPVFRKGAWRSLTPLDKGMVLGVLAGAVLAVLTWQILWIALGVFLGIGIGHLIGRRQRRVDPDLNAAMKFLHEARRAYKNDPARDSGEPVPSVEERFLAEFGRGRGNRLLAAIQRADTHPEVDRSELDLIIDRLLWMHR